MEIRFDKIGDNRFRAYVNSAMIAGYYCVGEKWTCVVIDGSENIWITLAPDTQHDCETIIEEQWVKFQKLLNRNG